MITERITQILAPHMGQATAHAVAVHVSAKFGLLTSESLRPDERDRLSEFLRRGLVAYVGAEKAAQLAAACVEEPAA